MLDYIAIGQGRLTNYFSEKPLIRGVVTAMVKPFGEIEDLANQVKTERWIDSAIGVQLDGAGYIVGEPRQGRDDDEYRKAILFKIFVNTSNATPSNLIHGLNFLTNPDDIQYIEQYPATAMLYTNGFPVPQTIHSVIQDLAPAAISDVPIMVSFAWAKPFRFGKESPPGELFVNDDTSYLEANNSDLQVQLGEVKTGASLGGIAASDLFVAGSYLDVGGPTLGLNVANLDAVIESGYHLTGVYQ